VFSDNYEDLKRRARQGLPTVLDSYGSTSPAEFFAVATEAFFERPSALRRVRPALFEELLRYYRVDPRRWQPAPEPGGETAPPPAAGSPRWPGRCDTGEH
jgi:Mlc titration factor MtfA (ptsG expression regulator)